jgi:two-component system cell cycle sensor histidine kinase/response regulator CckA
MQPLRGNERCYLYAEGVAYLSPGSAQRHPGHELGLLGAGAADVALLDSRLPGTGALEILQQSRTFPRPAPVLLVGAPGSIREAVQAMQHGTRNYLTRPLTGPEISEALREALQAVRAASLAATPARAADENTLQARKMEAVGRLASGVAHDFNNLLTVLTGYGELLLGTLPTFHPGRPYAEEILRVAERGAAVTRQLLSFSRKLIPEAIVVDLNELVLGMEKLLRPLIGEHVELRHELSAQPCPVKAEAGHLEQVIVNLAVNARDAMPGGGRLTLRTAHGAVAPSAGDVPAGSWVLLAVSDTGVGMDEPTRARLFEPFFTTKEPGKGTGLGLATVQGLVAQSGGRIVVHSDPGRGTTVNIYLPPASEALRPAAGPAASPAPPRGSETVLLLEDEGAVRLLLQQFLKRQGYRVLVAADGEEALRLAAEEPGPIHLLITDVVMPRLSGGEVGRRVAQARPGIAVLYISGYTDHPLLQQTLAEYNAAALAKPFTLDVLARQGREVLDRKDDKVTR